MRMIAVLRRCLLEQVRDVWSLFFSLTTASLFVLLYWSFTGGKSTTYRVLVLDEDAAAVAADGRRVAVGEGLVQALRGLSYPDGQPMMEVVAAAARSEAVAAVRNREAVALIAVPRGLSAAVSRGAGAEAPALQVVGDLTHPFYGVAMVLAGSAFDEYARSLSGAAPVLRVEEQALGGSGRRTEFESYVPGLLVVSIILVLFTVALLVARDVESGTLKRLQTSRMTAFDYLGGVVVSQLAVAVASLGLTLGVARLLGFRSVGPAWAALVVGGATALSVIGIGLLVACFARTTTRAFLVANVPFTALMFFSGAIFPMPGLVLGRVAGHPVSLWDVLPPTHAVVALNKILSLGTGLDAVTWELGWLLSLSLAFFLLGLWVFRRRHLRPG